jgi:hypothetical protein
MYTYMFIYIHIYVVKYTHMYTHMSVYKYTYFVNMRPCFHTHLGSVAVDKLEEMYRRMHTYLAESGIDGVKVGICLYICIYL